MSRPASGDTLGNPIAPGGSYAPKRARRGRPPGSSTRRGRAHRVDAAIRRTTYPALVRELGARLREIREGQDVSAAELALSVRVSVMTVLAWERGRSAPSLVYQLALSQALNCTLVDLLPETAHHRR